MDSLLNFHCLAPACLGSGAALVRWRKCDHKFEVDLGEVVSERKNVVLVGLDESIDFRLSQLRLPSV